MNSIYRIETGNKSSVRESGEKQTAIRRRELDVMSAALTLLVLLIHISSEAVSGLDSSSPLYVPVYLPWRLSMAAIQGFVFLSGIKFSLSLRTKNKFSYSEYLRGRFVKIVLPYLAVCLVYIAVAHTGMSPLDVITGLFTGSFDAHLYFVPLIMQFYLLAPLWKIIADRLPYKLALPCSFVLTLLYGALLLPLLGRCGINLTVLTHLFPAYAGFFTAGLYTGKFYDSVRAFLLKHWLSVAATGVIFSAAYAVLFTYSTVNELELAGTFAYHTIYCAAVLPSVLLASIAAERRFFRFFDGRFFRALSESTYYVYLIQCLVILALGKLLSLCGITGLLDRYAVKLIFVPIFAFSLSILIIIINRCLKHIMINSHKPKKKHFIASVFGFLKFIFNRVFIVALMLLIQILFLFIMLLRFNDYFIYFYSLTTIVAVCLTIYIINKPENPSYKIAWIVPILAMPIFGVTLFFIFAGNRITKRKKNKLSRIGDMIRQTLVIGAETSALMDTLDRDTVLQSKYITDLADCPPYTGNIMRYFPLGDDMLPVYLEELKKAKKYIFIEYFIIDTGVMWGSIHEILLEKVKEGVDVRLIYDDLGTIMLLPRRFAKKLCDEGIKTLVWNPFIPVLSAHQNNRDHRKITSIDGKVAFTGGVNIADEYINAKVKHGHWKDSAVMVSGEAAWSFTVMFLSMWDYLSKMPVVANTYEHYKPELFVPVGTSDCHEVVLAQPYTDNPLDNETVGENIYLNMINRAENYIWIYTPYLIIDHDMMTALTLAAKSGIDVRIITPGIGDKAFVHSTTRSFYPFLIESGVKIYEYTPGFLHAKLFLCDDKYATVGSVNLDFRSLYLHFECGIWLYDDTPNGILGDIKRDYEATLEKSKPLLKDEMKPQTWLSKCIRAVISTFAPLM